MKRLAKLMATVIFGSILCLSFSTAVLAFDPFNTNDPNYSVCNATNSNSQKSTVCTTPNQDPISGADQQGVLIKAAQLIGILSGVAAVIVIIIGGIEYTLSAGDSARINKAKNMILFAVVGLVIVSIAASIIAFVLVRL